MILDDLIKEFESIKRDNFFQKRAIILRDWQKDESDVNDLNETVDKFFRTIWFKNREDHDLALNLWSEFKDDSIAGIAGMTVNERLFCFGLLKRFDRSKSKTEKALIYKKLKIDTSF